MKLMVQPYNPGGYNAEEEETTFLHYAPTHGFDNPAEVTITLSDPTGLISQKYAVSNGAVGGAVSDNGGVETDETAEANEDTADDMTLLPAPATAGDAYYFGFRETFNGIRLAISTVTVADLLAIVWEYSTGDDNWTALSDVVDGTVVGALGYAQSGLISWTVPSDWATDTVGAIADLYWIRGRVWIHDNVATFPKGQQAWIGGVYIGPGKVTIEDPDGTDIFYGRIMKAEATADERTRTLTLYCQDWLSQLDEKQITYDMREKLSGNIRESTGHADPDGAFVDVAQNDGGTFYFFDDAMAWANDVYNGMYLIFTAGMAGKKEWGVGPYAETVTGDGAGIDSDLGDETDLWVDDDNAHAVTDDDENWTQDYEFRVYVGHNTPSDFYVHDSISKASIVVTHSFRQTGGLDATCDVQVYDLSAAAYVSIGEIRPYDSATRGIIKTRTTFGIPESALDCVDANGIAKVRFKVTEALGTSALYIYYIWFKPTTETTGYSSAVTINDTITTNKLEVATDLTAAAARVWERIPYCIAQPMYKHIASDETPGTLITGGDDLVTLTCAATIEHTSGISTRQYVGKTRLQIAKDLARQDKAHLWMALATTILIYKSTFNDGAPETLTDTDVNSWLSTRDYATLANEVTAYGMRIGDNRLSSTYTDTTSKATYGVTRTKVTSDTGLVSEHDTLARATALVNQYKDIQQILNCTIRGNTATAAHDKTLVLGDEVSITSTHLGLSSAVYIVQRWAYDSRSNMTSLLLHPRVSQIGLQKDERPSFEMVMQDFRRGTADRYIPEPPTHEVA